MFWSVRVLTMPAMTPGGRWPSRMKTSWYWVKMSGWPAIDGVSLVVDTPLRP
jgi:hypothetical protein